MRADYIELRSALLVAGLVICGLGFALAEVPALRRALGDADALMVVWVGSSVGSALMDAAAPALFSDIADRDFYGSGKIHNLNQMTVQLGACLGPLLGARVDGNIGTHATAQASGWLMLAVAGGAALRLCCCGGFGRGEGYN